MAASVNDPGYVYVAPDGPALYYAPAAEGELAVTVTATDTHLCRTTGAGSPA